MANHSCKMIYKNPGKEILALKGRHHYVSRFELQNNPYMYKSNDEYYIKPLVDDDDGEVIGFDVEYNKDWRWGY